MSAYRIEDIGASLMFDDEDCVIYDDTFWDLPDYTNSSPTAPRPGFVYRKNRGSGLSSHWFVYVTERDPNDPEFVVTHGRAAVLTLR